MKFNEDQSWKGLRKLLLSHGKLIAQKDEDPLSHLFHYEALFLKAAKGQPSKEAKNDQDNNNETESDEDADM